MDLTLFTVARALDSLACISWSWAQQKWRGGRHRTLRDIIPGLADSAVFAASAAVVMWAWFYAPERLPRSYAKWIGEAAKVDERLIEALRRARRGIFVYGKDTGQAPLLESMCKDFGWPTKWGDPAKTIPIPCEMVHMGCGPSCEKHAVSRFVRTFKFACATYIPLQIAFRLRSMKSAAPIRRAISDALRSSSFLASFVSLFYYSVCLSRTRLGPRLFDKTKVTPQMWDSGLCVGAGCAMCGWSILVEHAKKRQEIALFVAPRAAATVLPRVYDQKSESIATGRRFFTRNACLHQSSSSAPFNTPQSQKRNASTMYYTISIILGTVALAYGSVPLYKMICQQTGWNGQPVLTHRAGGDGDTSSRVTPVTDSRRLRITFNGSVSDVLPWKFTPQQREVRVLPGETALAFYTATNKGPADIIGVATYSVTPGQVAPYFSKIQCFCFEEQKLNAGESVDMPVFFFIDPDFVNDPAMRGIDTITLSYTFFKARYDDNGVLKPIAGS
ncbi:uncharacterized protein DSM5745_02180 [Aspergillus mulundensis]|uniref:Uncharacterized protein n=1 Tax=Aspergillus mulundensis TaxID=1810919 RepID=A0A3D8SVT6_9EURO|nr:Uncharacterized protein DSM5745_02180 [Aspergillus mulundensis]RDW90405.1 Uncharacterized protein DSM5745_02180 [Aspergillus mulundensis]